MLGRARRVITMIPRKIIDWIITMGISAAYLYKKLKLILINYTKWLDFFFFSHCCTILFYLTLEFDDDFHAIEFLGAGQAKTTNTMASTIVHQGK